MKVSIIGGGGRVGADTAFALQLGGVISEIALIDVDREMASGEALDLRHGSALTSNQVITSGGYERVLGSDCVIITAGLRRKPEESRMDLINRNVKVFLGILDSLKECKLKDECTLLVVSNPVDVLTRLAIHTGIREPHQVVGLGTLLDTCRFRSLLADAFGVGATDVNALILGEHGDSMVPIWSSASVNGVALTSLPEYSEEVAQRIYEETKTSGAEVIRQKGGAGRAVGISIKEIVESMCLHNRKLLPVSTLQHGTLGIDDIAISLPTILGRRGVLEVIKPSVDDKELEALHRSADSIRETWKKVLAELG